MNTKSPSTISSSLHSILIANDYYGIRKLPNGDVIGLSNFNYTVGLCYGLDESGYKGRYCYPHESRADAYLAVREWDGIGTPSGNWVAHK